MNRTHRTMFERLVIPARLQVGLIGVFMACFAAGAAGSCSSASNGKPPKSTGATPEPPKAGKDKAEFDLFVFGRVLGTIAPCGCTTEPLGGLQYAFGYIDRESKPDARVIVEPGSFLFPDPEGPEFPKSEAEWQQAAERAKALQGRFSAVGEQLVSGLGPDDVLSPDGAKALGTYPMPRVAANVSGEGLPELSKHRIVELESGGSKLTVGVTAVVDPTLPGADKLGTVADPVAAAKAAVEAMRKEGATTTIVLAHGKRPFAESIAKDVPGVDMVVVGYVMGLERQRLGKPMTMVDGTYVIEPGEQLQTLTHISLTVDASQKVVPKANAWTVVPSRAQREQELARIEEEIAALEKDPEAEKSFVDRLKKERDRVKAEMETGPEGAAIATFEQAKVTCKLPVDEDAKKHLVDYNAWVAETNKKRYAGVKAPEAPKGTAAYVGIEECETCHEEAVEFWKKTPHSSAYKTLVDTNQQFDLSCVSCHVTGFRKPGGSEVVENAGLIDVQCEVCHGPGSLHVDEPEDAKGNALNIRLEATEDTVCSECHTPEHSDTFVYDAYLRDIVGEGHGPEARKKLGDGPTGHELREAGLAKAGGSCKKM